MVVLDEREVDARLSVPVAAVRLQENTALVRMDSGLDPEHPGQRSFTHSDHLSQCSILIILLDILRYTLRI